MSAGIRISTKLGFANDNVSGNVHDYLSRYVLNRLSVNAAGIRLTVEALYIWTTTTLLAFFVDGYAPAAILVLVSLAILWLAFFVPPLIYREGENLGYPTQIDA